MSKRRQKRRAVTLIEIMIVMLLIGLIGGALALNMRGSMDRGRAFKTEQRMAHIYDALMMEYARGGRTLAQIVEDRNSILDRYPLVKGGHQVLLRDGWGNLMTVRANEQGDDLIITSTTLGPWAGRHE